MTKDDVEEFAKENEVEILLFSDYENCILGISTDNRAIYSLSQMVVYLNDKDGIEFEDAMDHISYNTLRSLDYIPIEQRPVVLNDL